MFTKDESELRYSQPEVVENKRVLSRNLQKHTDEFLNNGGKVTELPFGVKAHLNELRPPETGSLDSGYPGISWSLDRNQWKVRTTNSRVHIGYADSICEALAMQEKHQNKQAWKEARKPQ